MKAYARLLGGLEAIGCDNATAWHTLTRIAIDCAPALRTRVIRELVNRTSEARTSDIATPVETVTKTASRYFEDLSILRLAERRKQNEADNSPDLWIASPWLREYRPLKSETEKYPPPHQTLVKGDEGSAQTTTPPLFLIPLWECEPGCQGCEPATGPSGRRCGPCRPPVLTRTC